MTWIDAAGWVAAALTLAAYSMRTMLPLRSAAIGANVAFIIYGVALEIYPMLVLHLFLLPLNTVRLFQILRDRRNAKDRAADDPYGALRPFMRPLRLPADMHVFRAGDPADKVYLIQSGEVLLPEIEVTLGPGALLGEIAFFTQGRKRTASALCTSDCVLLAADERSFINSYYQDPALGLRITRLIAGRLHDAQGTPASPGASASASAARPPTDRPGSP